MKIEIIKNDDTLINQVVGLGTRNSKTLGHFPEGAYLEHARKGLIICAYEGKQLFGYLLFSITQSKSSIRLIQLCISETNRNQGIAKKLLDYLKFKYRESLKGIILSCRADYENASALWESYGFKAMNKVRSRSKKENWLYKWWYDFGNHDLFSLTQAHSPKIKAVLDANIIIKLRSNKDDELTGTQFLLEDWLAEEIDYYYSPEIFNEIIRDKDDERAKSTRSFLSKFNEAKFDPDVRDAIFEEVKKVISGNSKNDLSDKKQLSECIASEIPYFITTDKKILDSSLEIYEKFGTQVLRPIDIILLIDENSNKSDYVSTRVAGVNYDYSNLKSKEIESLIGNILAIDKGEKKHELRSVFTQTSPNVKNCKTRVVRDKENKILGVWICEQLNNQVRIPLIRTTRSKLSNTLFTQLTFEAIEYAISNEKNLISISDKFIDHQSQETLETLGFILKENAWQKVALKRIIKSSELFTIPMVGHLFDPNSIQKRLDGMDFKINIERKLWPLKFIDLDIPTYIIPIKPYWASELFDYYSSINSMFGAKAFLSWSRENIYYRNTKPVTEKVPSRLLWYSSSTKDKVALRVNSIVACSYLDEVHIGKAKELFQRFRHFGIFEWKNILELAKDNPNNLVKALKFRDTEIFKNAIPFSKVNQVLNSHGRKRNTFTAPLEINNEIFLEIYKLGHGYE